MFHLLENSVSVYYSEYHEFRALEGFDVVR